jgi:hypothetical protein
MQPGRQVADAVVAGGAEDERAEAVVIPDLS